MAYDGAAQLAGSGVPDFRSPPRWPDIGISAAQA